MDCQKVGALIRQLRKERHLTQKQLADALHISDKTVSKWECGVSHSDRYYTTTHAYTVLQGNNFWINIKKLCQHPL